MKRKAAILALVAIIALIIAVPVAAATVPDTILELYAKQAEIQKQLIDEYLKAGVITEAQAQAMKARVDKWLEYSKSGEFQNYWPGMGPWMMGRGFMGPGMMGGWCHGYDTTSPTSARGFMGRGF